MEDANNIGSVVNNDESSAVEAKEKLPKDDGVRARAGPPESTLRSPMAPPVALDNISPIAIPAGDTTSAVSTPRTAASGLITPAVMNRQVSNSVSFDESFKWGDERQETGEKMLKIEASADASPPPPPSFEEENAVGLEVVRNASPLISESGSTAAPSSDGEEDIMDDRTPLISHASMESIENMATEADDDELAAAVAVARDYTGSVSSDDSFSSEEEVPPLTVDEAVGRTLAGPVATYVQRHFPMEAGSELGAASPQTSSASRTGIVYDERMLGHKSAKYHPECPERVISIVEAIRKLGLGRHMRKVEARETTPEEVILGHTQEHYENVQRLSDPSFRAQMEFYLSRQSVYTNENSVEASSVSAGATVQLVEDVCSGKLKNGLAVVRPPGHHATCSCMMGFCLFNNVAVAAIKAKKKYGIRRILIVDWDVHHGNGTQEIVEDDPDILYFSAHRYEHGRFYPCGPLGSPQSIGGTGAGRGTCINVGWNGEGPFGDPEYLAVWDHILMPAARHFMPDLVLVSAGFDAAIGDPLGACHITPFGYGHMLHSLLSLAEGKCVVALEGGYNLQRLAEGASVCAAVLLGAPPPALHPSQISMFDDVHTYGDEDNSAAMAESPLPKEPPKRRRASIAEEYPIEPQQFFWTPSIDAIMAIRATLRAHHNAFIDKEHPAAIAGWSMGAVDAFSGRYGGGMSAESVTSEGTASSSSEEVAVKALSLKRPSSAIMDESGDTNGEPRRRIDGGRGFQIVPLQASRHLNSNHMNEMAPQSESMRVFAQRLGNVKQCQECGETEDIWICLKCYRTFCGRGANGHALAHSELTGHKLCMSYSDLSVWDYGHEAYLDALTIPELKAVYSVAHTVKFGQPPPLPASSSPSSAPAAASSAAPLLVLEQI